MSTKSVLKKDQVKHRLKMRGRPKKLFAFNASHVQKVLTAHASLSVCHACCSLRKTVLRCKSWFNLTLTLTFVIRVLESANHVCVQLDSALQIPVLYRSALIDQVRDHNRTLFSAAASEEPHSLMSRLEFLDLNQALDHLIPILHSRSIGLLLHDQDQDMTPRIFRELSTKLGHHGIIFWIHPHGLSLKLQRRTELLHMKPK